eukprot:964261_1
MRIQIKGGVWKNTEDEILKAAVMKYGKNQWARISSLLVRKSAKQCKARWFEWLDPSIKKVDWTREEEEKLLHLAKIMPTQWRTIAPIIGRTAAQCLEHYEILIESAQGGEADPDDPKRLRPGEIDPAPETKPARPDPIDMDEDEKEMLSEARARLANTKGKKAKRKAREKMLDEARRLAALQKRRELKAAGIPLRKRFRKRKFGVDYNEEIPFEKKAPKGFYDTTQEDSTAASNKNRLDFRTLTSEEFEGKARDDVESRERKKDLKRQRVFRQQNLPGAVEQIARLNDPNTSIRLRTKMQLPAPQVTDAELEDIARLSGNVSGTNRQNGDSGITDSLISQYNVDPTPVRTPRTPATSDNVLRDVQDLITLTTAPTPLAGGTNTPLHAERFAGKGAVPAYTPVRTPSALTPARGSLTPSVGAITPGRMTPGAGGRTPGSAIGSTTPFSAAGGTPLRDAMGINPMSGPFATPADGFMTPVSAFAQKRAQREEKRRAREARKKLAIGLKGLPAPQNNFNIIMPNIEPVELDDVDEVMEEDAADRDAFRVERAQQAEVAERARQSQSIQRTLPRPQRDNRNMLALQSEHQVSRGLTEQQKVASRLLAEEVLAMVRHDNAKFPLGGAEARALRREEFGDDELNEARLLLAAELSTVHAERRDDDTADLARFNDLWDAAEADSAYLPSARAFGSVQRCSKGEQLQCLQQEFELLSTQYAHHCKQADKSAKRIGILTGGYLQRAGRATEQCDKTAGDLEEARIELLSFERLYGREHKAIPLRQKSLKRDVHTEMERERRLQERYQSLLDSYHNLQEILETA